MITMNHVTELYFGSRTVTRLISKVVKMESKSIALQQKKVAS